MIRKRKALVILLVVALICSAGSVYAYYTSTDRLLNTFVVGDIDIELSEPLYEAEDASDRSALEPDSDIIKDPQVTNVGTNDAYIFIEVNIPREDVMTANRTSGAKITSRVQDLFDFSVSDGWQLVSSDVSGNHSSYVYAYTEDSNHLCKLKPGETTTVLFKNNKIHLINIVEGQGIQEKQFNIPIIAYAIQAENITASDTDDPSEVWTVICNQKGGRS